jgi:DNA-binding FrmR family transcriptional regulator
MTASEEVRQEMCSRLHRIEGQARGVQRMVEEGRDCAEIIHQLASIRAATHGASVFLLKHYAKECAAVTGKEGGSDERIAELIELMLNAS